MDEEVPPHRLEGALGDAGHEPRREGLEEVVEEVDQEHQAGDPRQARRLPDGDEPVDRHPHQVGADQFQEGGDDDERADGDQHPPEGYQVRQQAPKGMARVAGLLDLLPASRPAGLRH